MKPTGYILVLLLALALPLAAQDPVAVSPEYYTTLLENEFVRVVEFTLPPGHEDACHSHPPSFIFYLGDAHVEVSAGETSNTAALKRHAVFFQEGVTHQVKNIGSTPVRAVAFELLKPVGGPDTVELHPAKVDPGSNTLLFENDRVRAVYTITEPGDVSGLHEHLAMVVYAVTPAQLKITADNGEVRSVDVPAGTAIFSPPVRHTVENTGDQRVILLHVELK